MEPIAKALSTYTPESSLTLSRPLSLPVVRHVFDSLKAQLGNVKMGDLWQGIPVNAIEREWMAGLAGFQKHELQRGIDACATRAFAPTLGEFANLCRPCLNAEWAYWEANECMKQRDAGERGDWTHPAVYFAALEMGAEVRAGEWAKNRTRWTRTLQRQLAKGWREIPAPAMRVASDARTGPPPLDVKTSLGRLMAEMKEEQARRRAEKQSQLEQEANEPQRIKP